MDSRPERLVPATPEIARRLAGHLSAAHRREILETSGLPPRAALEMSLSLSLEAYAMLSDWGEPVFMMGVEPRSPLTLGAMVWMLGSAGVSRRPALTLRCARWGVARAFAATGADVLEQYLPAWYTAGLRFVRRLGFALEPAGLAGRTGCALWRATARRAGNECQ